VDVPEPIEPAVDLHLTAGAGGGTGTDGSSGNGPGAGGGVGSGVGTGRGSGLGPGTGGGGGSVYTPTPIQLFLPPMPPPARIRPYRLVAVFDIDETGRIVGVDFNPSKDSGYNRKLRDVLWQMRFKPAVTMDGTPVRAKYQMMIEI
jgi:protein TonB